MKIAESTENPAPIDQFKTSFTKKNEKHLQVSDKVTNLNFWRQNDKVGDPVFKNGWKPNLKWSDKEANFKCTGLDNSYRTFEKIIVNAKAYDEDLRVRALELDELRVRQAPRILQDEVRREIENEK